MSKAPTLRLKPGRDKSLRRHHPWIFSGAVAAVSGSPAPGATVEIAADEGAWLARGAYSPASQIVARVWTFDPAEAIDLTFFERQLRAALALRQRLGLWQPDGACRLVNAESDGLPGLIVDHYAGWLVVQALSAGAERHKTTVVQALEGLIAPRGVFERSDADVRHKEGLAPVSGLLAGEAPPAPLVFREGACQFLVDVYAGHKTGFYLDQRVNRGVVAERVRALGAPEVLNAFSYTGAFSVAALQAGAAHVTQIDSSTPALAQARRHLGLNGLAESSVADLEGDVFTVLRKLRDSARQFDLIILDPPKFAESQAQVARAARGYKDINLLAFKLLRPGGELVTFSCSGAITPDLFPKIVADAALDAGRSAQILQRLSQSPDHPVALNFPEGEYLKGLVCRDR